MESERLWRKEFVEQMRLKSGVKSWGSDRWWEWRWSLWWGDMCKSGWT